MVSVIVPVYNVEKYLPECIESIIAQSYNQLEIILVDDGSTDGSGKICDDYAKKDARIKVLHKENGGLSEARNMGIKMSSGKYLVFIDSDDFLHKDYVTRLEEQIKVGYDIVQCAYARVYKSGRQEYYGVQDVIVDGQGVQEYFYNKKQNPEPYDIAWNKMYKRGLFEGISYPVGRVHEDIATSYKLFYRADKIRVIPNILYYYRMREESITQRESLDSMLDWCEAEKERMEFYQSVGNRKMQAAACNAYYYRLRQCLKQKEITTIQTKELKKTAAALAGQILLASDYSIKEKIGILQTRLWL